jgi:gluconolactonase
VSQTAIAQQRGGGPLRAADQPPQAQEKLPRDITITAIPGVIAAGAKWQQAWQGADNADGIIAAPDGSLLFAQEQPNTIRKLDVKDFDSAFVKDTHGTGSIAMDSEGRIIAVQRTCTDPGRGDAPCSEATKVAVIYPERERKVLADNFQGKPLGRLNDLVVDKKGTVYFTSGGAYTLKPGGQVTSLGDNIRSNGIMLSPDEKTLYVTNGTTILAFDIAPDGNVTNRRDFARLTSGGGDGMTVDAAGRLYVTAQAGGVQVFSPQGNHLGTIPTPRDVITVAFAGPDKKTLYVVGSGALAPNGLEFTLAEGFRNNAKTIYKIPMLAEGFKGRAK